MEQIRLDAFLYALITLIGSTILAGILHIANLDLYGDEFSIIYRYNEMSVFSDYPRFSPAITLSHISAWWLPVILGPVIFVITLFYHTFKLHTDRLSPFLGIILGLCIGVLPFLFGMGHNQITGFILGVGFIMTGTIPYVDSTDMLTPGTLAGISVVFTTTFIFAVKFITSGMDAVQHIVVGTVLATIVGYIPLLIVTAIKELPQIPKLLKVLYQSQKNLSRIAD